MESPLTAAGWEYDEDFGYTPWRLPGITMRVSGDEAVRIMRGEQCPAVLCHGPGHQSTSKCRLKGEHDVHEAEYWPDGGFKTVAHWRTGDFTGEIRKKGIEFDQRAYPETIGMTGFFDEPPREVRDDE